MITTLEASADERAGTAPRSWAGLRQVRVLLNKGGRVIERGPDELKTELAHHFARAGVTAEVRLLAGGQLKPELAAARADAERGTIDAVVVGGGDGTVGTAAGVMADSGVPLGVLPLGTLNHFAKDLGMPLELPEAVSALAAAAPMRIDIGQVNEIVFVNNAVIGVYPYMVTDRERRRREQGLGKWVAMSLALLRMLWRFPRRRLKLVIAGEELVYRTPLLFVGVNEYGMENFALRRQSGLAGGELWLLVAKHTQALRLFWFALRSAFGGLSEAGDFDLHRATSVKVRTKASRVPVSHDGEVTRLPSPLTFRVRKGALTILAPPAADERAAPDAAPARG